MNARWRRAAAVAGVVGVVTAAAATVWNRIDAARRARLRRSSRVWALTARRGVDLAATRVVGAVGGDERRRRLDEQFAIRSAADVAAELGQMKGALMKLGQLASVVIDGLPDEARAALASLQADVPPMAPSLAAEVVENELGSPPERVFLRFDPMPVAAASVGQVHRAVAPDGTDVAVKVQYPGAADAILADLDNAEMLYGLASAVALPGLDPKTLVDELRARMAEELDYRIEAANQRVFAQRFAGHPWIRIPDVVDDLSTGRVLTTGWVDGRPFADIESADEATRQHVAEVVFRFAQSSVLLHRSFNGDPHPGNYRFADDGTVAFLDFGLVKTWDVDEFVGLMAVLDPVLDGDPDRLVESMVDAGFLAPDHGCTAAQVWSAVSAPYVPYFTDEFTFTPSFAADAMRSIADPTGPNRAVLRALNLPGSFVVLNRVLWGVSGLLGRLGATNRWRAIMDEYRCGGPPATAMGHAEAAWSASHRPGDGSRQI